MKLIPLFLMVGVLAASGWAEDAKPEPYSPELVKKAEAGDAEAQCALGNYFEGRNKNEAFKWFTKSAVQGNAKAQYHLGGYFEDGYVVKKDEAKAMEWYAKSAEQGCTEAEYALSNCYRNEADKYYNKGQKEEAYELSRKWLIRAAEGGYRQAQTSLGHYYFYATGSKGAARIKDLEESKKWWLKAQEQGDERAERFIKSIEAAERKEQRYLKSK